MTQTWQIATIDHDSNGRPIEVGTLVRVKAWGYGARLVDTGRTGRVVKKGRTRVHVHLTDGSMAPETRALDPGEIAVIPTNQGDTTP